jgi:hypothetical protein
MVWITNPDQREVKRLRLHPSAAGLTSRLNEIYQISNIQDFAGCRKM